MNLSLKRVTVWGLWMLLALAWIWPSAKAFAGPVPETVRPRLEQVAQLRQQGKAKDALPILEQAAKDAGRDTVSQAAVEYVQADIYQNDLHDTKKASGLYQRLSMMQVPDTKLEIPGYAGPVDVQERSLAAQDALPPDNILYKVMATLTGVIGNNPITGRALQHHTGVLAIFLLTLTIKLILTPLTKKSFTSMREMQKVQPLLKELQQRYKDKPAELNAKTMELYKEHGVNPFAGCLPMLLQMPIIILLWRAIGLYQYPLSKESFLWIGKLSHGDLTLALVYAASLFLSSKLTMMPTTDPQAESQQKMMAYMMPLMFFWLFKGYPAGFILGWLFFNVLTTAQQWQMLRQQREGGNGVSNDRPGGGNPGGGNGGSGPQKPSNPGGNGGGSTRKSAKLQQTSRAIKRRKNSVAAYEQGK